MSPSMSHLAVVTAMCIDCATSMAKCSVASVGVSPPRATSWMAASARSSTLVTPRWSAAHRTMASTKRGFWVDRGMLSIHIHPGRDVLRSFHEDVSRYRMPGVSPSWPYSGLLMAASSFPLFSAAEYAALCIAATCGPPSLPKDAVMVPMTMPGDSGAHISATTHSPSCAASKTEKPLRGPCFVVLSVVCATKVT